MQIREKYLVSCRFSKYLRRELPLVKLYIFLQIIAPTKTKEKYHHRRHMRNKTIPQKTFHPSLPGKWGRGVPYQNSLMNI